MRCELSCSRIISVDRGINDDTARLLAVTSLPVPAGVASTTLLTTRRCRLLKSRGEPSASRAVSFWSHATATSKIEALSDTISLQAQM